MRYIYFSDRLGSKDLNEIFYWATSCYGYNFSTEEHPCPKWGWIKIGTTIDVIDIIGIILPSEEDEIAFTLKFPYKTYGAFTTIERIAWE
jgi:hypothetical protein